MFQQELQKHEKQETTQQVEEYFWLAEYIIQIPVRPG